MPTIIEILACKHNRSIPWLVSYTDIVARGANDTSIGLIPDSILYGRLAPARSAPAAETGTSLHYKKLGSRQQEVLKLLDPDDFTKQYSSLQYAVDEIHQRLPDVLASASAAERVLYSLLDRGLVEHSGIDWKITEEGSNIISAISSASS